MKSCYSHLAPLAPTSTNEEVSFIIRDQQRLNINGFLPSSSPAKSVPSSEMDQSFYSFDKSILKIAIFPTYDWKTIVLLHLG